MSNTKTTALAACRAQLHRLEAAAAKGARSTLLSLSRRLHRLQGPDVGPRVRLTAWTDRLEAVGRIASVLGVDLGTDQTQDEFTLEDWAWCEDTAHQHASQLLERRMREALMEVKDAMQLRLATPEHDHFGWSKLWTRAGDGVKDRRDLSFPGDQDAAVVAALACVVPGGVKLQTDRLVRETLERLSDNLGWDHVSRPGTPPTDIETVEATALGLAVGDQVLGASGSTPAALFPKGPAIWQVVPMRDDFPVAHTGHGVVVAGPQEDDGLQRVYVDLLCVSGEEKGIQRIVTVYADSKVTRVTGEWE